MIEIRGDRAGAGVNGLNITASGSVVRGLAVNRFGNHGIFISGDNNVIVWRWRGTDSITVTLDDTLTALLDSVLPPKDTLTGVALDSEGRHLALVSFQRTEGRPTSTTRQWEVATRREVLTLRGPSPSLDVAFNPGGTRLATAGQDGALRIYVLEIGALLKLWEPRVTSIRPRQ